MHNLLQTLTDAHFRVIQKRCMAKVNFWRYVLYFINAFFVIGTIMELPQNFMLEIPSSSPSNITNMNEMPISQMTSISHQIFIFIDRYYFPIMNFGVVKVPQLFIMMIALRIAIMFRMNANILSKRRMPTRQSLVTYFEQLLDIIKVLNMLECCFNKLILAIVTTSVIKIIFTSYATLRELLYHEKFGNLGMMSLFMVKAKDNEAKMDDSFFSFIITIGSTFSVFELLLNILWTIIFIMPCIACNEFSRAALPVITGKLVPDDAKNKDQIIQKLMDPSWGLTLGKLLKVDRAFAMTLISLIFSIVVVWVQMTVPASSNST
uniref:Gustatory receptor n=1 Tax=Panagrolaimus superbus TaxID=310955 RepID=A0A914Y9W1_9BILA